MVATRKRTSTVVALALMSQLEKRLLLEDFMYNALLHLGRDPGDLHDGAAADRPLSQN